MLSYILLGLIQGITEFLPVSSSGHLILFKDFLGLNQDIVLDVSLHIATLLAVLFYYRKKLWSLTLSLLYQILLKLRVEPFERFNLFSNPIDSSKDVKFISFLILATIPAALIGYLYDDFLESLRYPVIVASMLLLVAFLMLYDYLKTKTKHTNFNYKNVVIIGLAQAVAIIPGTSRSGITITIASLLGIKKENAADFTFMLSIPVISGAFLFKIADVSDFSAFFNLNVVLAFTVALISGYFSIGLLINILKKYGFMPFIVYRILLALIVLIPLIL